MRSETDLLKQYRQYIKSLVNDYLFSTGFIHQIDPTFIDDLIQEASIEFLMRCRGFELNEEGFTKEQYAKLRLAVRWAVKKAIWRYFGYGGSTHEFIDMTKLEDISTVQEPCIEDDHSAIIVDDFISRLPEKERSIMIHVMRGVPINTISKMENVSRQTVRNRLISIRDKLNRYIA